MALAFVSAASAARSCRCTASWSPTRSRPATGASSRSSAPTTRRAGRAAEKVVIDVDKAQEWIGQGATPTDTVQALLKQAGVFKAATA